MSNSIQGPSIVVIGGGPIGLWEAIQTKLRSPEEEILIVEKHEKYKRAEIRLNIEASSLKGAPDYPPLQALVKKWGNHTVPITEMEKALTKCADEIGIKILKGTAADPKLLQTQFPTAKLFIGADGARSTVRKEIFGDQYKFNTPLQYIAQVQYLLQTSEVELDSSLNRAAKSYMKQKFAGHLISQSIRPLENGQSQVTLRIFIDQQTYAKMADATFGNPYYFEEDLNKVPDVLRTVLIKWWGMQNHQNIITDPEKPNKMTVIPLAACAAKHVFKVVEKENDPDDMVGYALVGDASQIYPFYRAINNGLLLSTKLAQCVSRAFAELRKAEQQQLNPPDKSEKQRRAKLFASAFTSYSRHSTFRAYMEYISAVVKSFFIGLANLWIKISGSVPWQSIKLTKAEKRRCYERGEEIWEILSGSKPPPRPTKKLKNLTPCMT